MRHPANIDRAVAAALGSLGFALSSIGAYIVLLASDLRVAEEQLTWLSSAFGLGLVLVAAVGPFLVALGAGRMLRTAAVALASGLALLAVAPSSHVAMMGAALFGVGGSVMVLVTPTLLRGASATARLSRVNAAASAAGIAAPVAMGLLDSAGINGRLALLGPVPVLLALAVRPITTPVYESPPSATHSHQLATVSTVAHVARLWSCVVLAVAIEFCFVVWGVARLVDAGSTTGTAAVLGVAFPIGMAVGRAATPLVIDRVNVVALSMVITTVGTAGVVLSDHRAGVAVGLALAGLGVSVLYPATLADLVNTHAIPARVTASLGALASGVAILAAPTVLAAVAGVSGLRWAFVLPLPLLTLLVVATFARRRPAEGSGSEAASPSAPSLTSR